MLGVRDEGHPKPKSNPHPNPNQVGGIWPGFRGNVTIKPCTTVVLDLNLDVQLYSLIIMQQAGRGLGLASVRVRLGFG